MSVELHSQSVKLHNMSVELHIQSMELHSMSVELRSRSAELHNMSVELHKGSTESKGNIRGAINASACGLPVCFQIPRAP